MPNEHLNPDALTAWVDEDPRPRTVIARDALVTPGHLHDLLQGRRYGGDPDLRYRLAAALRIRAEAITCWCDQPSRHRKKKAAA